MDQDIRCMNIESARSWGLQIENLPQPSNLLNWCLSLLVLASTWWLVRWWKSEDANDNDNGSFVYAVSQIFRKLCACCSLQLCKCKPVLRIWEEPVFWMGEGDASREGMTRHNINSYVGNTVFFPGTRLGQILFQTRKSHHLSKKFVTIWLCVLFLRSSK